LAEVLIGGVGVYDRILAQQVKALASGYIYTTPFVAPISQSAVGVKFSVATVVASATALKVALFLPDASGNLTRIAVSNSTPAAAATLGLQTINFISPTPLTQGVRYTVGIWCTGPSNLALYGPATVSGNPTLGTLLPRSSGYIASQADIGTSYTNAQLTAGGDAVHFIVTSI
jgi:hypothetical protein